MTLQSSGSINASDINVELRKTYNGQLSLNDSDARTLARVPSGQIAMSDFYGKSYGFNLYYSYYYNGGERGYYGSVDSNTNTNPGMTINGYSVQFIATSTYNNGTSTSALYINGLVGRYFFNNLYGWDGRAYTPSNCNYYGQYGGNITYWTWYFGGNNSGGLLYAPTYGYGSGYQVFTYN